MIKEYLKKIPLELILDNEQMDALNDAVDVFENVQIKFQSIAQGEENSNLLAVKGGTTLILATVNKFVDGKNPKEFTENDWKDIAGAVYGTTVVMDDATYSAKVFLTYADYIEVSANAYERVLSGRIYDALIAIAGEIRDITDDFATGKISEVSYVDSCLWLSLEGMFKLITATLSALSGKEAQEFADAIAVYAVAYGRLKLLQEENALLDEYLEHQKILDEELELKYNTYMEELGIYADEFNTLIADAFNADFRTELMSSVRLAQFAGVREEDILKKTEEVDEFFLS